MSDEEQELRLDAYYYGFEPTGVIYVDRILSAVACAGKAFHSTSEWRDAVNHQRPGNEGSTPEEWIQNAANAAASALRAELESLKAQQNTDNTETLRNALARIYELESKQAATVRSGLPPFALKVIEKLRRFEECATDSDAGGVDIGRHWLDILTQLGLLNRVQRSPGLWEITAQGEDLLEPALSQQSELAVLIAEAEQRGFIRGLKAENRANRANAELKAQQPSAGSADGRAVVMPERKVVNYENVYGIKRYNPLAEGWNDCLDEFAKINAIKLEKKDG